jgi:hypothetical protein
MKKYLLWIAAAIVAELAILLIGTVARLDRATLMLAMAVLPGMLFIAAIYMMARSFRSSPTEDEDKTEDDAG